MRDEEIDEMLQTMKNAGVPEAQVIRTLDILGRADELSADLAARLPPSEKQRVEEIVVEVIRKILKGDF